MRPPIRILRTGERGFAGAFAALRAVRAADAKRAETVARSIVDAVRRRGDRALIDFTARFDGLALTPASLQVGGEELCAAAASLPPTVRSALRLAARRIRAFHERQRQASWRYRDEAGLVLGQRITPLRRVGVYVPGGHAAYPSSVLMNVIPARVAGVEEVIMVSPAGRDGHAPAVLAAAHIAGATTVYRVGGAQAVAALAYGTRTIAPVDKIVGPGNAFVQAAKRLVYGQVDIDSTAGPSEVLVIADTTAQPAYVAADLLAQAEHGSGDECALLLTPSARLAVAVQAEIARQLPALPRRAAIGRVLARRGALVVVRDLDEAVALAEQVAPEHLELQVRNPARLTRRLRNAGAIFEGSFAPAPLGDYLAGPNHVLPTGGSARFFSPLGTYHFVKRTSIVTGSVAALRRLGPAVETLAELEGYQAHAAAVRVRFQKPERRRAGSRQGRRRYDNR
jgi:histidinol dehydrogenase